MKCLITGIETKNMWKGQPVCKDAVELAKAMEGEEGFKDCSQRERLIILKQRWDERVAEEAGNAPKPKKQEIVMAGTETYDFKTLACAVRTLLMLERK